ncbi:hypothetical protein FA15DRAFT_667411 [Coprinopsis marcescibilis]|uniref:F-box domain-containing protein n=1 Tax=Coprinopsis marcescibilis TaxID=230819 RepID=A0A5C3L1G4_COPMA|nr:hypothetical protein FA15DRAFT_667411 [Coprinopsis marcescibilis]
MADNHHEIKSFDEIPSELWDVVFQHTIPPTYLIHPVGNQLIHSRSTASLVLDQKLALTLTCKAWHPIGMRLLYEDVFIRHPTQAFRLLKTLMRSPRIGALIKHLHFCCFVADQWYEQFSTAAEKIITMCPHIFGIELGTESFRSKSNSPFQLSTLPLSVTHLQVALPSIGFPIDTKWLIQPNAPFCQTLVHLSIATRCQNTPDYDQCVGATCLPYLEYLAIFVTGAVRGPSPSVCIAEAWTLPSLRHFTVQYDNHDPFRSALVRTVRIHGKLLEYLHLVICPPYITSGTQELVNLCPRLEHLVISPHLILPTTHKALKWIDVWDSAVDDLYGWKEFSPEYRRANGLPSLRGIRSISASLNPIIDLPLKLPPSLSPAEDKFEINFLNFHLRCLDGDVDFVEPEWPDEDEDEDSTYSSFDSDCEYSDFISDGDSDYEVASDPDTPLETWDASENPDFQI